MFNLIDHKWVKVVMRNGENDTLSLHDIFNLSETIFSLAGPIQERVAVLSLIVSIAQAAIGKLKNEKDWKECRKNINKEALKYLQSKKNKFNLYGEFYQLKIMAKTGISGSRTKELSLEVPFGSRHTFFSHEAALYTPAEEELPSLLLQFQMFDTGGLMRKRDPWVEKLIISKQECPLVKKLLIVFEGECLLDTIWMHLVSEEKVGNKKIDKPIWDRTIVSKKDIVDYEASSYFGLLLPYRRGIFLYDQNEMVFTETIGTKDIAGSRHPMLLEVRKGDGVQFANVRSDRDIWREVGAALAIKSEYGMPYAYDHAKQYGKKLFIYAGGIPLKPKSAKMYAPVESVFCVENGNLGELWVNTYTHLVNYADRIAKSCYIGLSQYQKFISGNSSSVSLSSYWSKLGQNSYMLHKSCFGNTNSQEEWMSLCRKTAIAVFDQGANQMTPRGLEAYAMGKQKMISAMYKARKVN